LPRTQKNRIEKKGIRVDALADIVEQAKRDCPVQPSAGAGGEGGKKIPRITIAGVGGAGCNALNNLKGIESAMTLAINTDVANLRAIDAHKRILLATESTKGLGAGGSPEIGMKCAEECKEEIKKALEGTELLFITAGLGGGTGTGAAPVIAEAAKEMGATVIAAVNYPFSIERVRIPKADWGLDALFRSCDSVIVLDHNRLAQMVPTLQLNQAFFVADSIVARALKGVSDAIMLPSLVNIGFDDVRAIAGCGGLATIAVGEGSGAFKVEDAVKDTFKNVLLEADCKAAKGALVHITAGSSVSMKEIGEAAERMRKEFAPRTAIAVGAHREERLKDKMLVTAIAAGISSPKIKVTQTVSDVEKEKIAMEIANS